MSLRHFIRDELRAKPRIQFTEAEALLVGSAVRQFSKCRFLVFGVGHDSTMWSRINSRGTTVFLEHNPDWIGNVRQTDPSLDIRPVEYTTRITQWRKILDQPDSLTMDLPPEIRETRWDVVLVDAPNGFIMADEYPGFGPIHGRMQSLLEAHRLIAPGGYVFVHDAEREVEAACCDRFFKSRTEVFRLCSERNNGKVTELRCYFAPAPCRGLPWRTRFLKLLAAWLRLRRLPDLQDRCQGECQA